MNKTIDFQGFHSEWNLGSPGGWDYQRICQEMGELAWRRYNEVVKIDLELDFFHPMFTPTIGFSRMLLSAHKKRGEVKSPFIVLVAEEETIGKVLENSNLVSYLNSLDGVTSEMAAPHELEVSSKEVSLNGKEITTIFMDFNSDVLLGIEGRRDLSGLRYAINEGIVVNPRGMEPVGAKGVFEVLTTRFANELSNTTVSRTPWTRKFYPRSTVGPKGEEIGDLIEWTMKRPKEIILKPEHGYSGQGIFVGPHFDTGSKWNDNVETALNKGGYIVQEFIPVGLWSEYQPELDRESKSLDLRLFQTDFRCFITDQGLAGFCARYGDIPTNVGSGGGVQAMALIKKGGDVGEATKLINEKIISMGYSHVERIADEVNEMASSMGFTYLLGPIRNSLRPRLLVEPQITKLKEYARNLWSDCVFLERAWREGKLDNIVELEEGVRDLALIQPWSGSPALIASDGLFSFGAGV